MRRGIKWQSVHTNVVWRYRHTDRPARGRTEGQTDTDLVIPQVYKEVQQVEISVLIQHVT
jgi:hypothetical protein